MTFTTFFPQMALKIGAWHILGYGIDSVAMVTDKGHCSTCCMWVIPNYYRIE
jgi:hypothetical protein